MIYSFLSYICKINPHDNIHSFSMSTKAPPSPLSTLPAAMKNQFPTGAKHLTSPSPLPNLLGHLFLIVSALTLGIILFLHNNTYSIVLQVSSKQFFFFTAQSLPPSLVHGMSDEELLSKASMAPIVHESRVPKITFMF